VDHRHDFLVGQLAEQASPLKLGHWLLSAIFSA